MIQLNKEKTGLGSGGKIAIVVVAVVAALGLLLPYISSEEVGTDREI